MSFIDGLRHRLHVLIRGEQYAREVEREMRFHVELESLANQREGVSAADAELVARRTVGNTTYYREEVRRMTVHTWLDVIRQDASYAARGLRRSPGFTIAVVVTLGLGIGVNAAVFSLLDHIFLQTPSGVARPHEVRRLYSEVAHGDGSAGRAVLPTMAYPQFRAVRSALDSSIPLGVYTSPDSTTVRDGNVRLPARRSYVNPDYFTVVGVRASAGRLFAAEESDVAVPTLAAIVSDAFWQRALNGDRSVVGRHVTIGGRQLTIVGVVQPDFTGLDIDAVDVWMPANTMDASGGMRGRLWYNTFGARFNVIVRPESSANEDRILTIGTNAIRPVQMTGLEYDPTIRLRSGPIIQALGPSDQATEISVAIRIAGVALLVLIIACANVINLLLLRTTRRKREIAVRVALGVSRLRMIEQLTVESLLLAFLGAAVSLAFALWAGVALRRLVLPRVHWATAVVDLRTIAFVGGVALLFGIVAGLAPALEGMKPELVESLKAGSRNGAYRGSKLRTALLGIQSALCLVLLVGSGLFIRSLDNVESIGVGYDPSNQVFVRPTFDDPRSHDAELRSAIPEAANRLRTIDGVEAVAYTSVPPLQGAAFHGIYLPGRDSIPQLPGDYGPSVVAVSPGFFKATGLALKAGRAFNDADQHDAAPVIIVGESLARLYWPGQPAIGKCFMIDKRDGPCRVVVGVAADAHRMQVVETPSGQYYVPITQFPEPATDLIIRTRAGREPAVVHAADEILRPLLGDMTGLWARTFASVLEPQLRSWRLGATVFTALGLLALIVATVGVYSVVAYGVSQRIHEMGIRIALGARTGDILDLVLGYGLRVVVVGIAIGGAVSLILGRLIASLLYGVSPNNPSILIGASVILCGVGAAACAIPGWRAARVDPATALRAD